LTFLSQSAGADAVVDRPSDGWIGVWRVIGERVCGGREVPCNIETSEVRRHMDQPVTRLKVAMVAAFLSKVCVTSHR